MDNGFKFEKERRKMKTTTLSERDFSDLFISLVRVLMVQQVSNKVE